MIIRPQDCKIKQNYHHHKVFHDKLNIVSNINQNANIKNSDFLKIFRKHRVKFKWIKGHNNHPQNERCDHLAFQASKKETVLVDKAYEDQEKLTLL